MYNLNMLCSCVSRDVFGIKHEDEGWEINQSDKYKINQYANFVSPIFSSYPGCKVDESIYAETMEIYKKEYPEKFSNFYWRCKFIDITHSCVDFLEKKNPDYLIIDSYAATYNYLVLEDGTVVTDTSKEIIDFLIKREVIPPIKKKINFNELSSNDLEYHIERFAKNIQTIFRPEQIIIIDVKEAEYYLHNGDVHEFPPIT